MITEIQTPSAPLIPHMLKSNVDKTEINIDYQTNDLQDNSNDEKKIIEKYANSWKEIKPKEVRDSLCKGLQNTFTELYSSKEHFIEERIQNIHDLEFINSPHLHIHLHNEYLLLL